MTFLLRKKTRSQPAKTLDGDFHNKSEDSYTSAFLCPAQAKITLSNEILLFYTMIV